MPNQLKSLSDSQLLNSLQKLNDKEHEATLQILLYLIEVENRRLYAEEGYSSMFSFCTGYLKYSEGAAHRRIQSARAVKQFPLAYSLLESRYINLCTLSVVSTVLTRENNAELLQAISNKSRREVEALVSTFKPQGTTPRETIKPVSFRKPAPENAKKTTSGPARKTPLQVTESSTFAGESKLNQPKTFEVEQKFKLSFSASKNTMDKLNRVRGFMRFKAAVSLEQTFDALLDFYLKHKDPVKKAARRAVRTQHAKRALAKPRLVTRHIPSIIKEQVFAQGAGQCEYVSPAGKRCGETRNLQYDHVRPFAAGGSHDTENLRLLCPAHNRHTAEKIFGKRYQIAGERRGKLSIKEKLTRYRVRRRQTSANAR